MTSIIEPFNYHCSDGECEDRDENNIVHAFRVLYGTHKYLFHTKEKAQAWADKEGVTLEVSQ